MSQPTLAAVVVSLMFTLGCGRDQPAQPAAQTAAQTAPTEHDVDRRGMDTSVEPGDDFFRYANGGWLKSTGIPADRSSYGTWSVLFDRAQQRTRALLEDAAAGKGDASAEARKIGDFYASYLDETTIESKALAPLASALEGIAGIADKHALATRIGDSLRADVDPLNNTNFHTDRLFGIWISQDLNDPSRNVPYLLQGGLAMPDRDYYVLPGARMDGNRAAYRAHIAAVLKLAAVTGATEKAARIFELERRIARAHATRTESMEVSRGNNPWPIGEFARRAPGIDWPELFQAAHLDQTQTIIVWHPAAVTGIATLIRDVPLATWRDYLAFHEIDRHATLLPKALSDEHFAFYGKTLAGTPQQQERWKRAVDATNGSLGEAVGKLYVQRHFPPEVKAQILEMVANISAAFDRRIDGLSWMAPQTKATARAKLAGLKVGIGYPDHWRDYSGLEIVRGDALGNADRAERFDYQASLDKLTRAPDHSDWWLTPQTVNALNLPVQNGLNFPAAILEPPFYDAAASAAMRYGSMGAIIGHEISHSFDDQGSQFDASGRLANWWTPEDLAHFKASSAQLVAQYNAYAPFPDLHMNGQLTLSENIADVAGISAAYDGYRASRGGHAGGQAVDDRAFFISFGQSWRTKYREELARQIVLSDGHSLDEYRADTIRNLDAWYDAFEVKPGQRLFLAPPERIRVW